MNDSPNIREDIKTKARIILRRLLLHQFNDANSIDSHNDQWISQTRTDYFVKPYSKTHHLTSRLCIGNVSSISSIQLRRSELSQIRRAIPQIVMSFLWVRVK